jgi:cholesterol oxidase
VDAHADWKDRLFDDALRLYPVADDEECRSPVCHRITFLYALLYEHRQLDQRIHDNLHELFGVGNIKTFEHLALMVRKKRLVNHAGDDVYLPHIDRLRLPICFIHGAENQCYLPESTKITYDRLRARYGDDLYTRRVIEGYGHIDCIFGKNAARDVYPFILEHLDR